MKIKRNYRLRESGGSYTVISMANAGLTSMITLNKTGAFLWKRIQNGCEEEQLIEAMLNQYEVSEETARDGVSAFVASLRKHGILEE